MTSHHGCDSEGSLAPVLAVSAERYQRTKIDKKSCQVLPGFCYEILNLVCCSLARDELRCSSLGDSESCESCESCESQKVRPPCSYKVIVFQDVVMSVRSDISLLIQLNLISNSLQGGLHWQERQSNVSPLFWPMSVF